MFRGCVVAGDVPNFCFVLAVAMAPCAFLIVGGGLVAGGLVASTSDSSGLVVAGIGLGSLVILAPFVLRLCCVMLQDRLICFVGFRPSAVAIASLSEFQAEPFGSGSRVVAQMGNGRVQTLFLTPQPWWVSSSVHDDRVDQAVQRLRQLLGDRDGVPRRADG